MVVIKQYRKKKDFKAIQKSLERNPPIKHQAIPFVTISEERDENNMLIARKVQKRKWQ